MENSSINRKKDSIEHMHFQSYNLPGYVTTEEKFNKFLE